MLNGLAHVLVVASEPVHPADQQSVAEREEIEEPAALRPFGQLRGEAADAVVDDDPINPEPLLLGLSPLVVGALLGRADANVKHGLWPWRHRPSIMSAGIMFVV